jgi:hypothetical protein
MSLTRRIDVSATWEIELLISGLVLIGLLQLPALLDRFFDPRLPHAIGGVRTVLFALQLYLKAAAFALIASFVVHLVARGYWVGLIGLNSVFPRGPRWDQLRYGPVSIEYYRRRFQSLPDRIATVDDFCSVAFPFAFLVVFMVIVSLALGGVFGGITYLVTKFLLGGRDGQVVFFALATAFMVLPLSIALTDKKLGARIPPGSAAGRALRMGVRAMATITMMPLIAPVMLTLFSNIRKTLIYPVFYLAFFGVLAASFMSVLVRRGQLQVNAYDYFGPSRTHEVDGRFYETMRPEDHAFDAVPMIQSDMVADPYVRLFIPTLPRRMNPWVERHCPEVTPIARRGLTGAADSVPDRAAAATLACLGRAFAIQVNGAPRPELDLRFHEHPRLGLRGVITYIPTDSLPRGRNEIRVNAIPAADSITLPPFVIPFWR